MAASASRDTLAAPGAQPCAPPSSTGRRQTERAPPAPPLARNYRFSLQTTLTFPPPYLHSGRTTRTFLPAPLRVSEGSRSQARQDQDVKPDPACRRRRRHPSQLRVY